LAIFFWEQAWGHAGPFLDDRMLLGGALNGDERIYFRANIDGPGKMTSPEATVILGAAELMT